jgi:hypothetical protein
VDILESRPDGGVPGGVGGVHHGIRGDASGVIELGMPDRVL